MSNSSAISWWEPVTYRWANDDDVLDHHAWLDFNSASSLKESAGRHVAPLGHIILIQNQPVFALTTECCMLSSKAPNTNFIVFGSTRPGLEPTIYNTRVVLSNYYTTTGYFLLKCSYKPGWLVVKYTCMNVRYINFASFLWFSDWTLELFWRYVYFCFSIYYCIIPVRQ